MSKTKEESVFRRTSFGPTFYSQQLYQSRSKRNLVKPAVFFQSSTPRLTFLFLSDSPDLVDMAFLEAFTYRNSSTTRAPPPPTHQLDLPWLSFEPSFCFWWLETLGPSEPAFSLVKTTTTNGKAHRIPASTPHLVLPSTMTPASTQHLFLPSTMTPAAPTDLERHSMEKFSTFGANNNKPLLRHTVIAGKRPSRYKKLIMKMVSFPVMSSSTPILDPPTHNRRSWTTTTSRTSTRKLGFHLVSLFINFGPSLKFWPNTKNSGFKSETTRPRASKRLPNLIEDWKKSQVDSKKILAQPHQSFKSLSFSFFPRSEISFADDLAKKAVRSMTTCLSMFL